MGDKTFSAATTIFTDPRQVAGVVIPDGHRAVALIRGQKPILADVDPGEYEVDAIDLVGDLAVYPVALCIIDLAHVPAWENLSVAAVGRMLDRCQAAVDARAAKAGAAS